MQVITFPKKLDSPIVLCLGYFGCMHKGHVKLLHTAKELAVKLSAKIALFTFSNNHLRVLGKDVAPLYTFEERLSIYNSLNVDYVIASNFDEGFRSLTGKEFLQKLESNYNLVGVVCGFDHCCGSDRLNCNGISDFFANRYPVEVVEQISVDNAKISTTLVRELILNNKIKQANSLLTEPFFVVGTVTKGRGVGKTLGFSTANLRVEADKFLPIGVYGGRTVVDGEKYRCIVNIGSTPTFGVDRIITEVHLIGFNGDLYGKELKVSITQFLRNITRFDSADELSKQLSKDKETVLYD